MSIRTTPPRRSLTGFGRGVALSATLLASVSALAFGALSTPADGDQPPAAHQRAATPTALPPGFDAKALVALSDADMVATAYTGDGDLGNPVGLDALSVISPAGAGTLGTAVTPNAVTGPPASLAVTDDGRYAVVTEARGARGEGNDQLQELPEGRTLTLVDLRDPSAPRIVDTADVGGNPETVDISPDGAYAAVTLGPANRRGLILIGLAGGQFGEPVEVGLPGLRLAADANPVGVVDWHPSGRFLGIAVPSLGRVAFYRVDASGSTPRVRRHGAPVRVGDTPWFGRFSPDGRYFASSNGRLSVLPRPLPRSEVVITRFDRGTRAPRHRAVSRARTSVGPEGFSFSRDGRRIVTTNIERSDRPDSDRLKTFYSTLNLLSFDRRSGMVRTEDTAYYDGVLPESAVFDNSGDMLAVVDYERTANRDQGGVDFWRIIDDRTSRGPKLVRTTYTVPVQRGAHVIQVIR